MKTETKISVIAYDVKLKDLRTGEHLEDRVVFEKAWLQVLHQMGISDHDQIMQVYQKQGYFVLGISTRRKVELTVDLGQLYANQTRMEQLMNFGRTHSEAEK